MPAFFKYNNSFEATVHLKDVLQLIHLFYFPRIVKETRKIIENSASCSGVGFFFGGGGAFYKNCIQAVLPFVFDMY